MFTPAYIVGTAIDAAGRAINPEPSGIVSVSVEGLTTDTFRTSTPSKRRSVERITPPIVPHDLRIRQRFPERNGTPAAPLSLFSSAEDRPEPYIVRIGAYADRMSGRISYVIGPAGSGKTTYVRIHRSPGDLVLDFDAIAVAFGSPARDHHITAHPPQHRAVARALWSRAHELLIAATSRDVDVWIIHAEPTPEALAVYRTRGTVVSLPSTIGPRPNP